MKRLAFILGCLLFAVGLWTYVRAAQRAKDDLKQWPTRKVRVTYVASTLNAEGKETFTGMRWHYTDTANPTIFEITEEPIGRTGKLVWTHDQSGLSVAKDTGENVKLADDTPIPHSFSMEKDTASPRPWHTAAYYRKSPALTGTDVVAGFTSYVISSKRGEDGTWLDEAYSPEVGPVPLSIIRHRSDGSEKRYVAIKVEFP